MIGVAVRTGDDQAAHHYRQELADARILAAARSVAAKLSELSPEKQDKVRALFGGA
jgi:hypothetical protein